MVMITNIKLRLQTTRNGIKDNQTMMGYDLKHIIEVLFSLDDKMTALEARIVALETKAKNAGQFHEGSLAKHLETTKDRT